MKFNLARLLICGLLCAASMSAQAQQAAPMPVQFPELKLSITPPEAEIIWSALRKLPVEQVELLMGKIRQQVSEQSQPKKEPEK